MSADEYVAMAHTLPRDATALDYATFYPRALGAFFARLSAAFGWRYVTFVVLVYGLNQGLGESFTFFACSTCSPTGGQRGLELSPRGTRRSTSFETSRGR
ncbi:hypothetical protein KFE25_012025 [Diacronema lutheri]|uniref:Uncharacterized protein n=1 Tax=Diacronema lutheri TaxID=2081491 RepID=A0A8J5XN47_DIALT|nr:hypothetical protein KFE25_012025 [Diacronema lutheri]